MNMKKVAVPKVYTDSADFRFFMDWFTTALSKTQSDTTNIADLYDPIRIREDLLWLLADTMGYRIDDRLCTAFNRLVLLYFMSMIYNRGSKDGVALAASVNLAQFALNNKAQEDSIYYNRLEDPSIPVNAVYVNPVLEDGYIDIVYFSEEIPLDACIEYVRPLGMFCFQSAGVRADAESTIAIDARLTDTKDIGMSFGPTQIGHYRREDYARLQKTITPTENNPAFKRHDVWYRNSVSEGEPNPNLNPGYRALNSLQISNNDNIVMSLAPSIFSLGYMPQDVSVTPPPMYSSRLYDWNLRYDSTSDAQSPNLSNASVETIDADRTTDVLNPRPAVNPIMSELGDAMHDPE